MSAGQFHRPKPAQVVNAFGRIHEDTPTVFATKQELGRAKAHQSLTMTEKGKAAIAESNRRLDVYVKRRKGASR